MPLTNLKIIDPYEITQDQCPMFIQAADMRSFFGWGIRVRTKSNWNHSMIMRTPGKVVTQSWTYKEIDIKVYMQKGIILKFWRCKDITQEERDEIASIIDYDLKQPWYKGRYDVLGVIGQLFGMRWLNVPWLNYCSEKAEEVVRIIIPGIGKHNTPEDLDCKFKNTPRMCIEGYCMEI